MNILSILDLIFIMPILLLMEVIFNLINNFVSQNYILLFFFSSVINIIILPLYLRADAIQTEVYNKEKLLKNGIKHIKNNFTGEHRLLILNIFYKQNKYSQFSVVKSILPLIIEIPFFICSYRFLSNVIYNDQSLFDFINVDIYSPDGMLNINNIKINILPIIMTVISIISNTIYYKNRGYKNSIVSYFISILFLVLLYNSSSGIVLYWTYNNIFSLIKNIILTNKHGIKKRIKVLDKYSIKDCNKRVALLLIFNVVFYSIFFPSRFISSSVKEFLSYYTDINVNTLFIDLFCIDVGLFGIWPSIVYILQDNKGKIICERVLFFLSLFHFVNYFVFLLHNYSYSASLLKLSHDDLNIYMVILSYVFVIIIFIFYNKYNKHVIKFFYILTIALLFFSIKCYIDIYSVVCDVDSNKYIYNTSVFPNSDSKNFKLSTKGKNVIIIMLDTANSEYIRYIFNEKPELKEIFSGFRNYSNIISHASFTNLGSVAIFGGYEYLPIEMNKRNNEIIDDKRFEAYNVLPMIFKKNGYNTKLYNFDKLGKIKGRLESYNIDNNSNSIINLVKRFIMLSIKVTFNVFLQKCIYDDGNYLCTYEHQHLISYFKAEGKPTEYIKEYNTLNRLSLICEITDNTENNYMSIVSKITHPPHILLQTPDYTIEDEVDNEKYYVENSNILQGIKETLLPYYNSEMGAILCISKFIEFLKQNNVYDNTRIIIVGDHGSSIPKFYETGFSMNEFTFSPCLLIKDFNSTDFYEDDTFMTNADVPFIALNGLVDKPINPFTGKIIDNSEKFNHNQIIFAHDFYHFNDDKILKPSRWYSVHDNIYDSKNWEFTNENYVLDRYELPQNDCNSLYEKNVEVGFGG